MVDELRKAARAMRILVATDAWHPQVNGVVRTLTMVAEAAKAFGIEFSFLTPSAPSPCRAIAISASHCPVRRGSRA
jgi:hypothetical protein